MLGQLRPALTLLLFFTLLTGAVYPFAITGLAQIAFPHTANGSPVMRGNAIIGSDLIGQSFTGERYFQGRPSATSAPDPKDDTKTVDAPYNAANSSGSNLGPTSKKLIERVEADAAALKKNGAASIPGDAVTTSASGLDPHISPAFAEAQVARVAAARNAPADRVRALIARVKEEPAFGIIGEPRVNVLRLNLALDAELERRHP